MDLHSIAGNGLETIFAWRLVIAAVLGAAVGLERSLAGKHAGMRTYALVSLGSCLFVACGTLASLTLAPYFTGLNPLIIASNVVVGIGFLGAGLAVFRGDHPGELTTATGLWIVAAIGMAVGFGAYVLALAGTVIAVAILSLLLKVENTMRKRYGAGGEQ